MTNKAIKARLNALEEATQQPREGFKFDYAAAGRRSRRQKAVLWKIYANEGIQGLQKRHELAFSRGRHKLPRWLCGQKSATFYSDHIKFIEFEHDQMAKFVEFWTKRRAFLMQSLNKTEADFVKESDWRDMELKWQAAKAGDLLAFKKVLGDG